MYAAGSTYIGPGHPGEERQRGREADYVRHEQRKSKEARRNSLVAGCQRGTCLVDRQVVNLTKYHRCISSQFQ